MEAIVPPGNQNLIIDDNHHHGNRDRCNSGSSHHHSHSYYRNDSDCGRKDNDILDRISNAAENILSNDNANSHHASASTQRLGLAAIGATERNGSESRNNTDRNGFEARQLLREEGHEIRNNLRDVRESIARFGLKNLEATKDGLKDMLVNMKDDLKCLLVSTKDDFREVLMKNCQVEKDLLLQFKDAQLVALQNKVDVLGKIAECCDESKMLIKCESEKTRNLVRKIDEKRLRHKLKKAEDELLALRVRASLCPPLTPAVTV